MLTSARWLNDYLDPPATPDEQAELLTRAGFPLEGTEPVDDDVRQDFEMTSNRGDCVCHVGLAREIAALSGRALKPPAPAPASGGEQAAELITVVNEVPDRCPLYTARVIRGVKVGPSPDWMQQRLRARGDIPRNNVVDVTNFVLFELGQPTHVFDLAKLKDRTIVVRMARSDERFLPLGEEAREVRLTSDDMVIADASRAVAIAGVKGGAGSAVTSATTDVVIEAATFAPVSVRTSSRRHGIASDSSYRFERGVHPGQVETAAQRVAELILDVAGGTLCEGVVSAGAPIPAGRTVAMRPDRCRAVLGVPVDDAQIEDALARLGCAPQRKGDVVECTVPVHRLDLEREIDLIEEVGRMYGHDRIPITETISIRVAPASPRATAARVVKDELAGMGFIETVTHSLIDERVAAAFLPDGCDVLRVADARAGAESVLRPSVIPSLLHVRSLNARAGARHLRLFESAATFVRRRDEKDERTRLALLSDADDDPQLAVRTLRGAIERLTRLLRGPDATVEISIDGASPSWLAPGGEVRIGGEPLGWLGLVGDEIRARFDLDDPVAAAELELPRLYDDYPPDTRARALPAYPAIERDVSAVLDEATTWDALHRLIEDLGLNDLERVEFVTTFRGRPIPSGKKSVTFRCRFRAPDRTLQHEEIDGSIERLLRTITERLGAEIRS